MGYRPHSAPIFVLIKYALHQMKGTFRGGFSWLLLCAGVLQCCTCLSLHAVPGLQVSSIQSNGWVRIYGAADSNAVMSLDASSNLVHWKTIAVLHGRSFEFADPVSPQLPYRFYRLSVTEFTPTNDWKNQVHFSYLTYDSFAGRIAGDRYVKFAIVLDEPARVYYADSAEYLLHYDFATARLERFIGISPDEFDQISLYNEGREVLLGAVIFPEYRGRYVPEFGIQFVSRDLLPREMVREFFELVRSTVGTPPDYRAFYIPAFEQTAAAEADRAWLEMNGIPIGSMTRWSPGDSCYALGWAIGTLKFFAATNINAAYADGRLLPHDILLTDGVPSELPYVAGIVTLAPSTPNSHVAILARSYGVPFVHLSDASGAARAMQLVDREIVLQLSDCSVCLYGCSVSLHALDPTIDPALKAEILAIKNAQPLNITPTTNFGAYTASTENLTPADIKFFGGKAANYGLLRRTIPSNAPVAIAISFDLWNEFMVQRLSNGKTLRQEITDRLAGYTYPRDIGPIKTALDGIRRLIRQNTQFATNQQQAIIAALRVFDSRRNIRFRSSTNVEDTEAFTGAGLYDSYSGCLDDDLDGDNSGPSHCDPSENEERGVFRAIRRVYASFYNDNAYLERFRRGIDESQVGMAMLVHHSTPDDIEMANGVATATSDPQTGFTADLVSQIGAISVANPDGTGVPEVVQVNPPRLIQPSNLIPLGDYVMDWPSDYEQFGRLFSSVSAAYRQMTGKAGKFLLDFEYKKVQPGWLEVKQVREIPQPATNLFQRYFLNDDEPLVLVPYQGLESDLFATHRLKSRWTIRTRNFRLAQSNLNSTIFTELTIEHLNGTRIETLSGPIQSFNSFSNSVSHTESESTLTDSWRMPTLEGMATLELRTWFGPESFSPSADQFLLSGVGGQPKARYDRAPAGGYRRPRDYDQVWLRIPRSTPTPQDVRAEQTFTFTDGSTNVTITVIYTVGPYYRYGDTRHLIGTPQTRIEGLTTEPIFLTNYYSQTMSIQHLSGWAFVFEPRLEPGISPSILSELEALNIRFFFVATTFRDSLSVMGFDGVFRRFGSIVGKTLTVSVTASDGPPFPPPGSTYTIFFKNDWSCIFRDDQGNEYGSSYHYQLDGDTAILEWYMPTSQVRSTLAFESATAGAIHSQAYDGDTGALLTEDGTFTLE